MSNADRLNLLDRFRVDDQVAIVTAASRGIGAASAIALAEAGADVVIAARDEEKLAEVAGRIEAAGRKAVVVAGDLDDLDNTTSLVDVATTQLGGVDIVVNNVGGSMPQAFLDTSVGQLERAFHFNVSTAFALTRAAAPVMLERGGGAVVNMASAMSRLSDRGFAAYSTAKAALAHMTRLLAADLAPRVRVNAVAPGAIRTDALGMVLNDELEAAMVAGTPMRRLGEAEDIALAVLYLATPASSYVTGKVLDVDGGIIAPNLSLGLPDL